MFLLLLKFRSDQKLWKSEGLCSVSVTGIKWQLVDERWEAIPKQWICCFSSCCSPLEVDESDKWHVKRCKIQIVFFKYRSSEFYFVLQVTTHLLNRMGSPVYVVSTSYTLRSKEKALKVQCVRFKGIYWQKWNIIFIIGWLWLRR